LPGRRSAAAGVRQPRPLIRASVAAAACCAAASTACGPEPKLPSSMSIAWPCAVATRADASRAAAVSLPPASSTDGGQEGHADWPRTLATAVRGT
jgi:hypothetical protein